MATALAALWLASALCLPHDQMINLIEKQYGETRRSGGHQATTGEIFETWGNDRTGTWTILRIDLQGKACMVGSGGHFKAWPSGVPA